MSTSPALFKMAVVTLCLLAPLPPAAQATQATTAAAQLEDLAVFERDFFAVDRSYSTAARTEAQRRIDALKVGAGTRSNASFVLALGQIVALADNGHTMMASRGSDDAMARVGIRFAVFGKDFVVVRALSEHAALLGGRLLTIDGVPVEQLRAKAHTLSGGIAAWRDRQAPLFLESPGQLHALGLVRSPAAATYRFVLRDGSTREVALSPSAASATTGDRGAGLMTPATQAGWQSLLSLERAPWSLQATSDTMRRRDAPEMDATVIQLRANVNGAQPIATFLAEAEAEGRAAGRKNIVLDMRMNGGGNLQLTRAWMQSIVSRLPADGRVVVLTSPWTFSAAISSTGYLKQAGGSRVVLAGEAPGDRMNFFAEGGPVTLPNSGAVVLVARERHDYQTGCKDYTDCHPPVARFPIAVPNLDPEVAAPWTLESYVAGRDPGMDAAASRLRVIVSECASRLPAPH